MGISKKDNKYYLAPVFDNGSCLFPNLIDDDELEKVINDEEQINLRIYKFPTSQIKLKSNKSSYFDVISSLEYEEINNALLKIFPIINIEAINSLIDNITIISSTRKKFYKVMIKERYEKILKYSYSKLKEK